MIKLEFNNNDRNAQVLLPVDIALWWERKTKAPRRAYHATE